MKQQWMLAPARLAPQPLLPRPVKNPDSPGFPVTEQAARSYAMEIKAARAKRVPWRTIAEQMSITRIEAIRLAHSLDDVLADIRSGEAHSRQDTTTEPQKPLPPSLPLRLIR